MIHTFYLICLKKYLNLSLQRIVLTLTGITFSPNKNFNILPLTQFFNEVTHPSINIYKYNTKLMCQIVVFCRIHAAIIFKQTIK